MVRVWLYTRSHGVFELGSTGKAKLFATAQSFSPLLNSLHCHVAAFSRAMHVHDSDTQHRGAPADAAHDTRLKFQVKCYVYCASRLSTRVSCRPDVPAAQGARQVLRRLVHQGGIMSGTSGNNACCVHADSGRRCWPCMTVQATGVKDCKLGLSMI